MKHLADRGIGHPFYKCSQIIAKQTGAGSFFLGYLDHQTPEARKVALYPGDDPVLLSAIEKYRHGRLPRTPMQQLASGEGPLGADCWLEYANAKPAGR